MGRGQWGEGITGTTIKDSWTKSKGRVEMGEGGGFGWGGVEGWGEKAYNCNCCLLYTSDAADDLQPV